MFRYETSFSDMIFVYALLFYDGQVYDNMKYLPIMTLGLLIPMIVTPIILFMWVNIGTANANYLFFVLLVMQWTSVFSVVEYTRAALKLRA